MCDGMIGGGIGAPARGAAGFAGRPSFFFDARMALAVVCSALSEARSALSWRGGTPSSEGSSAMFTSSASRLIMPCTASRSVSRSAATGGRGQLDARPFGQRRLRLPGGPVVMHLAGTGSRAPGDGRPIRQRGAAVREWPPAMAPTTVERRGSGRVRLGRPDAGGPTRGAALYGRARRLGPRRHRGRPSGLRLAGGAPRGGVLPAARGAMPTPVVARTEGRDGAPSSVPTRLRAYLIDEVALALRRISACTISSMM